ncbi:MAG: hypothetical protein GY725_07870 [bacterium]|nr:hypothetical protein [bacterium]
MTQALEGKLEHALQGTPLAEHAKISAESLIERRGKDACVAQLEGAALSGVARLVASNAEAARYLAMRPTLFEQLCTLEANPLTARGNSLLAQSCPDLEANREDFLDEIRLMRRDEMLVAACCHFGSMANFEAVSQYLSIVAETCVRWALAGACHDRPESHVSVLGMGKIAGREFTYHSDLDLIFLYADEVEDVMLPSRTAQRFISYLSTPTGAGFAYTVDSRLRPSGNQGALVTKHSAYTTYQTSSAAPWEHLALMRARAIAGEVETAQAVLDQTRTAILRETRSVWPVLADMRRRIEAERASGKNHKVFLKTGVGGLMDVEFLAGGCLLECRRQIDGLKFPSIAAMLEVARADMGVEVEGLVERYSFLRNVEACSRFVAGRPAESLDLRDESTALVSELVESGLTPADLAEKIQTAREANRQAFNDVVSTGSIAGITGP